MARKREYIAFMPGKWTILAAVLLGFLSFSPAWSAPQEAEENTDKMLVPVNGSTVVEKNDESKSEMGDDPRRQKFLMELRKLYPQDLLPVDMKKN